MSPRKMLRALPALLACLAAPAAFGQTAPDGAWVGGVQLEGEWMFAMVQIKTQDGNLQAAVLFPFHNINAAGTARVQGSSVQIEVRSPSRTMQFSGELTQWTLKGRVQSEKASGTFEMYRQLDPAAAGAYTGFYQGPGNQFFHVQKWDEMGVQFMFVDQAGEIRSLFPVADSTFIAGPTSLRTAPVEIKVAFVRDKEGRATGLRAQRGDQPERLFEKVPLYDREDVKFQNGAVTLAGTLFLPRKKGPLPALVLTHGSGPQDRYAGLVFMTSLLHRGVAVFSYDKRGVGESGGNWEASSFQDLAGDALAAVEVLKKRKEINAKQIGIWGLSQGGWIAPLAASISKDIAFVIAVSAAAVSPVEQELIRTEFEMRADGYSAEEIQESLDLYRRMNHYVRTGQGWEDYLAARKKAVGKRWFDAPPEPPPKDLPYFVFWKAIMDYDPLPALEKLQCPILAVYGELDQNVRPAVNGPIMEKALQRGGNKDVKIVVYPTGNHVIMEGKTGGIKDIPETRRFVPGYFDMVTQWVLERVTVPK